MTVMEYTLTSIINFQKLLARLLTLFRLGFHLLGFGIFLGVQADVSPTFILFESATKICKMVLHVPPLSCPSLCF